MKGVGSQRDDPDGGEGNERGIQGLGAGVLDRGKSQQGRGTQAGQQADRWCKVLHDPRGRPVWHWAAIRVAPDAAAAMPMANGAMQVSTIPFRPRNQSTPAPTANSKKVRLLAPFSPPQG